MVVCPSLPVISGWTGDDPALAELLRQRRFRLGDDTVEDDPGRLDIVDQIHCFTGKDESRIGARRCVVLPARK